MIAALALLGCPADDPSKPTGGETPTPPDTGGPTTDTPTPPTEETGHTGGDPTSVPTDASVSVTCAPTDNLLRYTCAVTVDPPQAVTVSYVRADGATPARTASSDDVAGTHDVGVYFLAQSTDYEVTAWPTAVPTTTASTTFTTAGLPAATNTWLEVDGTSSTPYLGTHLPCAGDAVAVVYDTVTGDLVWYEELDPGGTFGGNDMVQYTEDHTVLGESQGDVIEVDLMGEDVIRLNDLDAAFGVVVGGIFGNFHHDIFKRNDVYYVFYQESYGFGDVLDTVILFDGTGTELARWYPIDHLDLPADWGGDFLHTNSIWVDEAGDMLLSWHSQGTVGKIEGDWTSADFGTPLWLLRGDASGELGNTITTDWGAVSPRSFSDQHCANLRPDGRLTLLDNSSGRGLVLSVDELNGRATADGAYATGSGQCGPQGTAQGTLAGNEIVGCTGTSVREYDGVSGAEVWSAEVQCANGGGGGPFGGANRWYPLDGW